MKKTVAPPPLKRVLEGARVIGRNNPPAVNRAADKYKRTLSPRKK